MKYKAFIFDLDGTLLDTLEDLADAMNAALAACGMPTHPVESYRYFVGLGIERLAEQAAPRGTDPAALKRLIGIMGGNYTKNWSLKTRTYPGILEILITLRQTGLKLAVLSNKPDDFTQVMVEHYFPQDTFDVVSGAVDGVPKKPDPTAALNIAAKLEIRPDDIIYVGDTNTDMQTGVNAGMFTLGVSWGFRPAKELTDAGARSIVDKPQQFMWFLQ